MPNSGCVSYVHMYTICVMYRCVHVGAHGSQRPTSSALVALHLVFLFRQALTLNVELI